MGGSLLQRQAGDVVRLRVPEEMRLRLGAFILTGEESGQLAVGLGIVRDHPDRLQKLGLGFLQTTLLRQGIGMFVDRRCCVCIVQSRLVGSAQSAQRNRQIDVR